MLSVFSECTFSCVLFQQQLSKFSNSLPRLLYITAPAAHTNSSIYSGCGLSDCFVAVGAGNTVVIQGGTEAQINQHGSPRGRRGSDAVC